MSSNSEHHITVGNARLQRRWRWLIALVLGAESLSATGAEPPIDYAAMLAATVSIRTLNFVETDFLGDSSWSTSRGSGIVVSTRPCEIWTNYHNVSEAALIEVSNSDDEEGAGFRAEIFNADPRSDIAILRMKSCPGMIEVKLGDSDRLRQGETVFAVGNPTGHNPNSISRGIISHTHRQPEGILDFVQTDAAVCTGSSGGGLFNRAGELIGMTSAAVVDTEEQRAGFGYSVPVNLLRKIALGLRAAPPSQAHIGLEGRLAALGAREALHMGVPRKQSAVIVIRRPERPPAAGLLELRDIIYELDGVAVTNIAALNRVVGRKRPDETLRLSIARDGKLMTVSAPVITSPIEIPRPVAAKYEGHLGVRLEDWGDEADINGAFDAPVITHVMNLGPAHYARMGSNQHYLVRFTEETVPVLMEVRTLSAVIEKDRYLPIISAEQIEQIASAAAEAGTPLLVEVKTWLRNSARYPENAFVHRTTSYHLVEPRAFVTTE